MGSMQLGALQEHACLPGLASTNHLQIREPRPPGADATALLGKAGHSQAAAITNGDITVKSSKAAATTSKPRVWQLWYPYGECHPTDHATIPRQLMLRFQTALAHTPLMAMMGTGTPENTAHVSNHGAGPPKTNPKYAAPAHDPQTFGCKAAVVPHMVSNPTRETASKTRPRTLSTQGEGSKSLVLAKHPWDTAAIFLPPRAPLAQAAHERKWQWKKSSAAEVVVRLGPPSSTRACREDVKGSGRAND